MNNNKAAIRSLPLSLSSPDDVILWHHVNDLLNQQERNVRLLSDFIRSFPKSGLYADESSSSSMSSCNIMMDDNDDKDCDDHHHSFADFVRHVQTSLAQSPRTVLRHAVNKKLYSMLLHCDEITVSSSKGDVVDINTNNNNNNNNNNPSTSMTELFQLLGLCNNDNNDNDHNNGRKTQQYRRFVDISILVDKLNRFPRGRIYEKLMAQKAATNKKRPWHSDPVGMRARIERGFSSKKKNDHKNDTSTIQQSTTKATITKQNIDAIVQAAIEKEARYHQSLQQNIVQLQAQLKTDPDYLRYERVQELWQRSGIQQLWDDYIKADREEGKERRHRGFEFESNAALLCFAMIVCMLQREYQLTTTTTATTTHRKKQLSIDDCRYVTGARWCDEQRGKLVGEIDLVILHKDTDQILAICEMKAGCFEIASAFAQHQEKLDLAFKESAAAGEAALQIVIVNDDGSRTSLSSSVHRTNSRSPPQVVPPPLLFVATLLPSHRNVLGVEPALSKAICDGIRNQGLYIRDDSTHNHVKHHSLSTLLESGLSRGRRVAATSSTSSSSSSSSNSNDCRVDEEAQVVDYGREEVMVGTEETIDLEALEAYVRGTRVNLNESPAGCVDRCSSRLLVFNDEDLINMS